MKVVDLFCGGGGISEGLRLAGFKIVYGLDNSKAAVDTFQRNHPKAEVVKASLDDIQIAALPEFDILVGGPPCVEFSASKQGRGNILAGLKLVQAFLRVVHERQPKFWIMENVPKIIMHLPAQIPLKWIGIDEPGNLDVPVRAQFNAADYGVAQNRKRFLMGNFAIPRPTHYDPDTDALFGIAEGRRPWVCLSDVLNSLPSPLKRKSKKTVGDLNYGRALDPSMVSDHYHHVALDDGEARQLRKAKEAHPFMGWMPFPDRRNRPARTVVATQLGRETLIIGEQIKGKEVFRRATIRECAVIQGYPLSYQFLGSHLAARYRVVGNGVPPLLIYQIGREIRKAAGLSVPRGPKVSTRSIELSTPILNFQQKKQRKHRPDRRFSELVPGKEVRGCRVELTNLGKSPSSSPGFTKESRHLIEWTARLTVGEGKGKTHYKSFSLEEAYSFIEPIFNDKKDKLKLAKCVDEVQKSLPGILCDASTLQRVWMEKTNHAAHPYEIVEKLSAIINRNFPAEAYRTVFLNVENDLGWLPNKGIRLRLAVALFATAYCCEIINKSSHWALENSERRYIDAAWVKSKRAERFDQSKMLNKFSGLSR